MRRPLPSSRPNGSVFFMAALLLAGSSYSTGRGSALIACYEMLEFFGVSIYAPRVHVMGVWEGARVFLLLLPSVLNPYKTSNSVECGERRVRGGGSTGIFPWPANKIDWV